MMRFVILSEIFDYGRIMERTTIRPLCPADLPAWRRLRDAMSPYPTDEESEKYAAAVFSHPNQLLIFVSESSTALNGFIEVSLRPYAEGCSSSPVGYIERWYVAPEFRRAGVGRQLIEAAEHWARSRNCREIASDTELTNVISADAHIRLGYAVVRRMLCFRKDLRVASSSDQR
jgi:aminoglycoside 6'-N-acetyltransferase I